MIKFEDLKPGNILLQIKYLNSPTEIKIVKIVGFDQNKEGKVNVRHIHSKYNNKTLFNYCNLISTGYVYLDELLTWFSPYKKPIKQFGIVKFMEEYCGTQNKI